MEASSNHGKSLNETNNSLCPSSSQKPWGEMLVTSASEVAAPRCPDFIASPFENSTNDRDFTLLQTVVLGELEARLQPEFRFTFARSDVNVHSSFLPRKEEKAVRAFAKDRRTHDSMLHRR
jgi:hypothetical protein